MLGLRANAGQFSLLVGVNALVGVMLGQERTVLPLLATDVFGLTAQQLLDVPGRLRGHEGAAQPGGRRPRGPLRPEARPRRGLARRPPGPRLLIWARLGLDRRCERAAWGQPGPRLVDDRDHEDRPGRPDPSRAGDRTQRSRGLRRGRGDSLRDRAPRPNGSDYDQRRSSSALPAPGSGSALRSCSCARRAGPRGQLEETSIGTGAGRRVAPTHSAGPRLRDRTLSAAARPGS